MPHGVREFKGTAPGEKGESPAFGPQVVYGGHAHPHLLLAVFPLAPYKQATSAAPRLWAESLISGSFQPFTWHSMGEKEGKKRSVFVPQQEEI